MILLTTSTFFRSLVTRPKVLLIAVVITRLPRRGRFLLILAVKLKTTHTEFVSSLAPLPSR